ncbi:MAG: hypothetical protein NTZ44_03845 [Candidatus Nomurabacteria bacterium]|nr:hypothetical protein [Candidatus Nomurabacteria bacterium]
MEAETRNCQNCKKNFLIEAEDFDFYQKMKVPPPTFCPDCRYKRRAIWRNARHLFRGKDYITGKELFTGIPPQSGLSIYEQEYWNSDKWDSLEYGIEYDFSTAFFKQFNQLFRSVPYPAKSMQRCINCDYSNMCDDMKNCYLCFNATFMEDSAYCCNGSVLKNCFDLTSCYNSEFCYDNVRVDKSYHTIGSVNSESCVDVWFSKNCVGCTDCFGCVNLRNAKYFIFNKQFSKEEYFNALKLMNLGTWDGFYKAKIESQNFWEKFPIKYMLGFRNHDVLGEDIKDSKNVKYSYIVQQGENLKYVQDVPFGGASNSYDYTCWGVSASQIYECMIVGEQVDNMKFCFECWPVCQELEYCINMRRSKNCFGCVGMKDAQYCILNKKYSKEDYFELVEKIKKHMDEMPYIDKRGNLYKYGEFFPVELSHLAYNETLLNDQFPLDKETVEKLGFIWHDINRKEYEVTILTKDLPQIISETHEAVTKEIIECIDCKKAYRIILNEFNFLKNFNLPLPRNCVDCRFSQRQRFMVPPVLKFIECMCSGYKSSNSIYKNNQKHTSHEGKCQNTFQTAYNIEKEIIYCEKCYQSEVY